MKKQAIDKKNIEKERMKEAEFQNGKQEDREKPVNKNTMNLLVNSIYY